ncbi:hypothetical protein MCUN1_002507 [Malassezia cuniculi]|uniref:Auxin efflux carrier n=1 Tax=Malassezia cuniculi TaxID=948313 RepID=A0AAF0EV09_9BASI|nr:hypothetical protein MCUN1_002507 [Malassezia cuniculi]
MLSRETATATAVAMVLPAIAPMINLVGVTFQSILQVVLLSAVGYFLAVRGILDKRTQGKLNKLNVSILTPSLLFTKVAFSLTPERFTQLLIVPIGFVLVTCASALAAFIMSWVLRLPRGQRNFVIACAISPNSNTLPVALMQSLVESVPELHWRQNGVDDDTPDSMLGRALSYLIMYSTLGMVLRWSVGARLLSQVRNLDDEPPSEEPEPRITYSSWTEWLIQGVIISTFKRVIAFMTVPLWAALLSFVVALIPPLQHVLEEIEPLKGALKQAGQCSIPLTILVLGAFFHADSPGPAGLPPMERDLPDHGTHPSLHFSQHVHEAAAAAAEQGATAAVAVPGAAAASTGIPNETTSLLPQNAHAAQTDYTQRTVWAAVLSRMVMTPLIVVPILALYCLYSPHNVVDDPVFITSACLLIGSPPALTLAQISAQNADPSSNVEALISGTIFISYAIFSVPTTIILVLLALLIDEKQALHMIM